MSQPAAIHLDDYQAPAWRILSTRLTFDLAPSATRVTAVLTLEANPDAAVGSDATPPLVLNGIMRQPRQSHAALPTPTKFWQGSDKPPEIMI